MSHKAIHLERGTVDTAACFDPTRREIAGLFDSEDVLNDVVEELQIVGFDRAEISVLPSWKSIEKKVGRELRTVAELEGYPDVPRAVPVDSASLGLAHGACIAGPLYLGTCGAMIAFSAGGAAFTTIAVAGIAAGVIGATLGILPVYWMKRWHRRYINDLLDRGGLVLWARISDETLEERARTILTRNLARNVRSV